jgi:hypothetical protein
VRERETSNSLPREVSGGVGVVASNISVEERPARLSLVQVNWVGERERSSQGDFHGSKERSPLRGIFTETREEKKLGEKKRRESSRAGEKKRERERKLTHLDFLRPSLCDHLRIRN